MSYQIYEEKFFEIPTLAWEFQHVIPVVPALGYSSYFPNCKFSGIVQSGRTALKTFTS